MGEMVSFPSNGTQGEGYLAVPESGAGTGVLVIQAWWGLNDQIKSVVERLAGEGFVALAPDLYHGQSSTESDGAGKLMMALNLAQAGKDLSGAIDLLQERSGSKKVGVVGYCMGGALALVAAAQRPDAVAACAPYYGVISWEAAQPDWSKIEATIVGEYAEIDGSAGPEAVRALETKLRDLGKDATMHIHAGAKHAFFNDTRAEVYSAADATEAWDRTTKLFRDKL